jgi:hypothetical protein
MSRPIRANRPKLCRKSGDCIAKVTAEKL